MALVFVHGIDNRDFEKFDEATQLRGFFGQILAASHLRNFRENPDLYSSMVGAWRSASLESCMPAYAAERLGAAMEICAAVVSTGVDPSAVVPATALSSVPDAVGLLFSTADLHAREPEEISELVDLGERLVSYCEEQESQHDPGAREADRYPWLREAHDDDDVVDHLLEAATPPYDRDSVEVLGGSAALGRARTILTQAAAGVRAALVDYPGTFAAFGVRRLLGGCHRNTAETGRGLR
jgi:hypothetical protein